LAAARANKPRRTFVFWGWVAIGTVVAVVLVVAFVVAVVQYNYTRPLASGAPWPATFLPKLSRGSEQSDVNGSSYLSYVRNKVPEEAYGYMKTFVASQAQGSTTVSLHERSYSDEPSGFRRVRSDLLYDGFSIGSGVFDSTGNDLQYVAFRVSQDGGIVAFWPAADIGP
jgi:hypothetical protein